MEREISIRRFGLLIETTEHPKIYMLGVETARYYCYLNEEKLRKLAVDTIRAIKDGKEENFIVTKGIVNIEVTKDTCNLNFTTYPSFCIDKKNFDEVMRDILRFINNTD